VADIISTKYNIHALLKVFDIQANRIQPIFSLKYPCDSSTAGFCSRNVQIITDMLPVL